MDAPPDPRPLVLTLTPAPVAQDRLDALRGVGLPSERNHLQAHVTLFHALPGEHLPQVGQDLADVARCPAYDAEPVRVRSPGRDVARRPAVTGPGGAAGGARAALATVADPAGRPCPRGARHPAERGPAAVARALLARLLADLVPHVVRGTGLALWRYLGGPWEPLGVYPCEAAG